MHLHGYKFYVLGGGKGSYDGDKSKLNLVNPPLLDTMNVEGDSWLYLRFVADNPGAWIMHCVRRMRKKTFFPQTRTDRKSFI